MAAPAFAFTISRTAEMLGEDEQLLWDLADEMDPEDGCLWIHGTDDQQTHRLYACRDGIPARAARRAQMQSVIPAVLSEWLQGNRSAPSL
jgi:hypothetical protein